MKLSQLFTKTSKESQADADSINADLLTKAGYISKTMAGVYSYLPLGLKVLRKIEQVVREEMDAIGAQELLLSALSPAEFWQKTDRWDQDKFDALYHLPAAGDQTYAVNPTHEEVISPIMVNYVSSYRDLPFGAYQIQTKFRNELRAKSGVLRGREFLMKDLYSFHRDEKCLDKYYETVMGAYDKVFERLGLGEQTYFTYASGGAFSQYSHEYQILLPSGEDTIYISEDAEKKGKRVAINKEIFTEGETKCPETGGTNFKEVTASEAGNIFKLGTKFSEPFGLEYTDEDGKRHPVLMCSYGIGISRLMGIMAEATADDKGLNWPSSVAPAQVHIVAIAKEEKDASYKEAEKLYKELTNQGIDCLFDDRLEQSVGSRLADADLMGVPVRVVVSEKTLADKGLEVTERASGKTEMLSTKDLVAKIT